MSIQSAKRRAMQKPGATPQDKRRKKAVALKARNRSAVALNSIEHSLVLFRSFRDQWLCAVVPGPLAQAITSRAFGALRACEFVFFGFKVESFASRMFGALLLRSSLESLQGEGIASTRVMHEFLIRERRSYVVSTLVCDSIYFRQRFVPEPAAPYCQRTDTFRCRREGRRDLDTS